MDGWIDGFSHKLFLRDFSMLYAVAVHVKIVLASVLLIIIIIIKHFIHVSCGHCCII